MLAKVKLWWRYLLENLIEHILLQFLVASNLSRGVFDVKEADKLESKLDEFNVPGVE